MWTRVSRLQYDLSGVPEFVKDFIGAWGKQEAWGGWKHYELEFGASHVEIGGI